MLLDASPGLLQPATLVKFLSPVPALSRPCRAAEQSMKSVALRVYAPLHSFRKCLPTRTKRRNAGHLSTQCCIANKYLRTEQPGIVAPCT